MEVDEKAGSGPTSERKGTSHVAQDETSCPRGPVRRAVGGPPRRGSGVVPDAARAVGPLTGARLPPPHLSGGQHSQPVRGLQPAAAGPAHALAAAGAAAAAVHA